MNMTYSAPIMIGTSTSSTSILTKTSSSSLKSSYSSNSSSSYYSSTLMSCEFLSSLSKDLSLLLEDDVQDYNMIINDLDKSIISRVKDPSRAINYYNNYGPSFGTGDLKMTGNFKNESRCCCQHGDYELPIRANSDDIHFSVDEYEVFQIIPRRRRKRNMD
ncbi:5358_t:CDS:2 [Entrophospora sp. SA101]|nr:11470_t:CDS:2 [Entrophospora sp. SA101]CAJ0849511.1 5358_t:CDS:2 [Entrophospora sp. SA101]